MRENKEYKRGSVIGEKGISTTIKDYEFPCMPNELILKGVVYFEHCSFMCDTEIPYGDEFNLLRDVYFSDCIFNADDYFHLFRNVDITKGTHFRKCVFKADFSPLSILGVAFSDCIFEGDFCKLGVVSVVQSSFYRNTFKGKVRGTFFRNSGDLRSIDISQVGTSNDGITYLPYLDILKVGCWTGKLQDFNEKYNERLSESDHKSLPTALQGYELLIKVLFNDFCEIFFIGICMPYELIDFIKSEHARIYNSNANVE